jgi:sodium/potassium-transporting ATPase subunit alpha
VIIASKGNQISPFTNMPVCFTPEAAKYAQTAYFIGIVWGKFFTFFACRTNLSSTFSHRVTPLALFSLTVSLMLVLAVAYFQPFNNAFRSRDVIFIHFGISAIPFGILQLVIDELRKYTMRELSRENHSGFSGLHPGD